MGANPATAARGVGRQPRTTVYSSKPYCVDRYRAGIPWRDMPERFGHYRKIHTRHRPKAGVWKRVFELLASEADNEYVTSTIGRAHRHSAGAKGGKAIGRSRGGLSRKIHAVVDTLDNPISLSLSEGQTSDLDGAKARVIEPLQARGITVVVPSRCHRQEPRDYDKALYKARHWVENFFAKLKQDRAIATRYDKLAQMFLASIYMAASSIWLIGLHALRSLLAE